MDRGAASTPVHRAATRLGASIRRNWADHLTALAKDTSFAHADYYSSALPRKTLWLTCSASTKGIGMEQIRRACEAIALLNILSDLDVHVWQSVVRRLWLSFHRRVTSLPTVCDVLANPPLLGLSISIETAEHVEWIAERVVGVEPPSQEYEDAFNTVKQVLLASNSEKASSTVDSLHSAQIPVLIKVNIEDRRIDYHHRVLRQLLQVAIAQHCGVRAIPSERDQVGTGRGGFDQRTCLSIVGVDGSGIKHADLQGLKYFRRIADHDIRIVELPVIDFERESKLAMTKTLRALFQSTEPHRQFFGVNEIEISDFRSLSMTRSSSMTVPLLSLMQTCRSLDSVFITLKDPQHFDHSESARRGNLWRWIAYALFSRDARHNIQHLTVDARNLRATDVTESFIRFAEDGTSTLEVLVIGCFVHLEFMGLIELFEALANATHPLAKSLCEPELNIIADGDDDELYGDDSKTTTAPNWRLSRLCKPCSIATAGSIPSRLCS